MFNLQRQRQTLMLGLRWIRKHLLGYVQLSVRLLWRQRQLSMQLLQRDWLSLRL